MLTNQFRTSLLNRRDIYDAEDTWKFLQSTVKQLSSVNKEISDSDLHWICYNFWMNVIGRGLTLETWASPWLANPDGEIERKAQKLIIMQIVSRIYGGGKEGQKVIIALRGSDHTNKSSLIWNLAPEEQNITGHFLFRRGLLDNCQATQLMRQKYILEFSQFGEIENSKKAYKLKRVIDKSSVPVRKQNVIIYNPIHSTIIGNVDDNIKLEKNNPVYHRIKYIDFLTMEYMNPAIIIPQIREHIFALARDEYLKSIAQGRDEYLTNKDSLHQLRSQILIS